MSKLTESWRSLQIITAWDFAEQGEVFIEYQNGDWLVMRPGYQTFPEAPWYHYGNKAFKVLNRHDKQAQLDKAKAWAFTKYGITEWARTPYGSWMEAEFVKQRTAELKALVAISKITT